MADVQITHRDYRRGITPEAELISKGAQNFGDAFLKTKMQGSEQDAALRQMLQGKQQDLTNKEAEITAQGQQTQENEQAKTANSIKGIQTLLQQAPKGASVGLDGATIGQDPWMRNMQGQADAVKTAQEQYMKELPHLQDKFDANSAGLKVISDPKQIGSVGQARTLALKAYGMNRYNPSEAEAVVPQQAQSFMSDLFNKAGDDNNPLSPAMKQGLQNMYVSNLQGLKQRHDTLKQQTLGNYQSSPFYDASRAQSLQGTLGAPLTQNIDSTLKQYAPPAAGTGTIRVKAKTGEHAGKTGTIPENEYDPNLYDKVQ